jgi:hypothetical protein
VVTLAIDDFKSPDLRKYKSVTAITSVIGRHIFTSSAVHPEF